MSDIFTKKKRSEIMSRIGGKNTLPELAVRSWLHKMGFRFRLHSKKMPGKPDIVLSKYQTVIFVQGCFWHAHNCKYGRLPKSNLMFWQPKLEKNKSRDEQNFLKLKKMGWKVIVLWECSIRNITMLETSMSKIKIQLKKRLEYLSKKMGE